ncbi:MAG: hypothetical protein ACLP0J_28235 [Solirubrobacteraceae bacterium]|jgi:hypothetical protein
METTEQQTPQQLRETAAGYRELAANNEGTPRGRRFLALAQSADDINDALQGR